MKKALIMIDYINEIVHPEGKLSGKGYYNFIKENNVEENIKDALNDFRKNWDLVLHVRVWFDKQYINHPENSPLFWKAKEFWALNLSSWGCEFIDYAKPLDGEVVVDKNRVSAFYGTNLDSILKCNWITDVYLAWCSTDLAIESACRDAHDRDYNIFVLEKCCSAGNIEDHNNSIKILSKITKII